MKVVIEAENPQLVLALHGSCLVRKISIHDILDSIGVVLTIQSVWNKCVCAETGDQRPLENRIASRVNILKGTRLFLHLLVIPPSLDQRLQHTAHDPDPSSAEMVPQLGDGETIRGATGAVERLGGDVVLHHDARIQGGKVEFVEALVHSDFRFEREATAISAQQILGILEILGSVLLPDDEATVLVC